MINSYFFCYSFLVLSLISYFVTDISFCHSFLVLHYILHYSILCIRNNSALHSALESTLYYINSALHTVLNSALKQNHPTKTIHQTKPKPSKQNHQIKTIQQNHQIQTIQTKSSNPIKQKIERFFTTYTMYSLSCSAT